MTRKIIGSNSLVAVIFMLSSLIITLLNQRQDVADYVAIFFVFISFAYLLSICISNDCLWFPAGPLSKICLAIAFVISTSFIHYWYRDDYESFARILASLYPVLLMVIFYALFSRNELSINLVVFCVFIAIALASLQTLKVAATFSETTTHQLRTNWSNVIGSCVPVVFLLRNKIFKWLVLLAILIFLAIGLKRSGIICGIFALLLLVGSTKNKSIWEYLLIAFICVPVLYILFEIGFWDKIIDRLSNIAVDGGAGRDSIIISSLGYFLESPIIIKMVGEGIGTMHLVIAHHQSAHNDILDFLLNYGIIGMSLYVLIYVRLFHLCFLLRRTKYYLFSWCVFIVFVIYSNIAGLYYYYYFFSPILIFVAYLESAANKVRLNGVENRKALVF